MVVRKKMFRDCSRFRTVCLFVNCSAVLVKTVFKSSFCFSYVLNSSRSNLLKIKKAKSLFLSGLLSRGVLMEAGSNVCVHPRWPQLQYLVKITVLFNQPNT